MPPERDRSLQMMDPTGAVATHVDRAFIGLEQRAERVLAGIRLLALLVLALVFRVVGTVEQGYPTMVPLGGLAVITLITLWLVRLGLFRPWLSWLFTTLDVAFLTHCLIMLAYRNGESLELALNTPVALLVFVFLATAAVRHRPLLILYTGGLFIATWAAIWLWDWRVGGGAWLPGTWTADLAWLAVVGLASYALFVAVTRARRTAVTALAEGHLRENLSRYFSPQVVDEIAQSGGAIRSFREQKAAILFIDLRGFTSLAEQLPADKVAAFLNDYRRRIGEPIARYHGIIDKFIGDGAMAIFGVPEPRGDEARNAALAGVALISVIDGWRSERLAGGLPPVEVGIGIHYGDVIAGALGDENRLEYTVVGDAVNTAARIERLAADLGTPLLVSADILAAAPGLQQDLQLAEPVTHLLRGRSQPIRLYQLGVASTMAGARRT